MKFMVGFYDEVQKVIVQGQSWFKVCEVISDLQVKLCQLKFEVFLEGEEVIIKKVS